MRHLLPTISLAIALIASTAETASAEINLVDSDALRLDLGAYVGSFTGYQRVPYDTMGFLPDSTGTNAALVRFEWRAGIGERITLDVQNRFFWNLSSVATGGFGGVGLGSTVPPERTLDLESDIIDESNFQLRHDLDRLAITLYVPAADITVGRQAVTWGNSSIFTTGDLWTQFSPFEIDISQKRGVDALRILSYPGDFEFEAIIVDRGGSSALDFTENLSGGFRLGWVLGRGDYYAAIAKNYSQIWTLMGMAADLGVVRGHGELGLPLDLSLEDDDPIGFREPRATIGADWFATPKLSILGEYHFNGPGVGDQSLYLAELQSPEFGRGERYFVGKHYAGTAVTYRLFDDELIPTLAVISNLGDPSALIAPSLMYQISQNVTGTLGAYLGVGDYPELRFDSTDPRVSGIEVNSEYGLYGHVFYLQLSGYL